MSIPFYALDKPGEKGVVLGNEIGIPNSERGSSEELPRFFAP